MAQTKRAFDCAACSARAAAASDGRATSRSAIGAAARCCARPRRWCPRRGIGPTATGKSRKSNFLALANSRYRAPDPFLDVRHQFIFRRIAADSRKIELGDDAGTKLHLNLLQAMGFDLASVHAAARCRIKALQADLQERPRGWLNAAAAGCGRQSQARLSGMAELTPFHRCARSQSCVRSAISIRGHFADIIRQIVADRTVIFPVARRWWWTRNRMGDPCMPSLTEWKVPPANQPRPGDYAFRPRQRAVARWSGCIRSSRLTPSARRRSAPNAPAMAC